MKSPCLTSLRPCIVLLALIGLGSFVYISGQAFPGSNLPPPPPPASTGSSSQSDHTQRQLQEDMRRQREDMNRQQRQSQENMRRQQQDLQRNMERQRQDMERQRQITEQQRHVEEEKLRETPDFQYLEHDIEARQAEVKQLKQKMNLNKMEVTIVRYYHDDTGTSGYVFVDDKPLGYALEPAGGKTGSALSSVPAGSYEGRFHYDPNAEGGPKSVIELDNGQLFEIKPGSGDEALAEIERAVDGLAPGISENEVHRNKEVRFLAGKFNGNTGVLVMSMMASIGRQQQYFDPNPDDKPYVPHFDEALQFFNQRRNVVFVQFGKTPYQKREGTTNCVEAPLEALYKLVGGKDGTVNGIPVTDPSFNTFTSAFVGVGDDWVKVLHARGMADAIPDLQSLRIGDLVQLENHRAFVSGRVVDARGVLTEVVLLDAMATTDSDWRTRSAIREGTPVPLNKIKYAARLYDLEYHPSVGLIVVDVDSKMAKSLQLAEPKGVWVKEVSPGSPAEKAGLKPGDVVLEFNGHSIQDHFDAPLHIYESTPGNTVSIKIWRDGNERQFNLTIGLADSHGVAVLPGKFTAHTDKMPTMSPKKDIKVTIFDQTTPAGDGREMTTSPTAEKLRAFNEQQFRVLDEMRHQDNLLIAQQVRLNALQESVRSMDQMQESMRRMNEEQARNQSFEQVARQQREQKAALQYLQQRHQQVLEANRDALQNLERVQRSTMSSAPMKTNVQAYTPQVLPTKPTHIVVTIDYAHITCQPRCGP